MTTPISLQTDTMLEWMPNIDDKEVRIQAMMMQLRLQEEEKEVKQEAERRLQAAKQLEVAKRRYEQEMRQQAERRFQAEKQRLLKEQEEENRRLYEEKKCQEEEQRQKLLMKRIEEQEEKDRVALETIWQRNKEATGKTLMECGYWDLPNQMEKFYMWTFEGKKYYRNGFSHVFDRNDNGTVGEWRGCFFGERGFMYSPMPDKYMYGPPLNGPSWC